MTDYKEWQNADHISDHIVVSPKKGLKLYARDLCYAIKRARGMIDHGYFVASWCESTNRYEKRP